MATSREIILTNDLGGYDYPIPFIEEPDINNVIASYHGTNSGTYNVVQDCFILLSDRYGGGNYEVNGVYLGANIFRLHIGDVVKFHGYTGYTDYEIVGVKQGI